MCTLELQIPDDALTGLGADPQTFAKELVLLGAVKLFELGRLSSGRAAELAGMPKIEFLDSLHRYNVSPFQLTDEELEQDILNA